MSSFRWEKLFWTPTFVIVYASTKANDAYTRHRDTDQRGTDNNYSIGFVSKGNIRVYTHDDQSPIDYARGDRSPSIMTAPSYTLTSLVDTDYFCVHAMDGERVVGDVKLLVSQQLIDVTEKFLFIAEGKVVVDDVTYTGPDLLEMTGPKNVTCSEEAVVMVFNTEDV